jgi:hypothetical protein
MLSRYLKKKRQITVLILILVYSLLLCQEVVLNRVLCVNKGKVELECTFLNFQCPCQDKELSVSNDEDIFNFKVDENCHLHIPLAYSYLARILPSDQNIFYQLFSSEIYIKTRPNFENHIYQLHHLLPYIRYLQIFPYLDQYFILLC